MDREATDGDGPVTPEALADLQAGLLDDETAARLRRRARAEPDVARQLAALDRVRRSVADLGTDAASAPDIPAEVTARIGTALRSLSTAGTRPPRRAPSRRGRRGVAAAGVAAIVAAGAVGTIALLRHWIARHQGRRPSMTRPGSARGTAGPTLVL